MKNTMSRAVFAALALSLTPGCFNNIAGSATTSSKTTQGQGGILDDSGFSSEVGDIVVDTSLNNALIGTYLSPTAPANVGIMVDLRRALVGTIGETGLQGILESIDSNTSIQQRKLIIRMPQFGIKATTTLARVAMGNNKKLRSVMNIRPGFARVDFATWGGNVQLPESPNLLQLGNSNKTVISYGGKIEGEFYRLMSVLIPYAGQNAGMLPSVSAPTYGDGYPTGSPEETLGSVRLMRVTQAMATAFNKIITAPQDATRFTSLPDTIRNISQTYGSLALAVHKKMVGGVPQTIMIGGIPVQQIEAAYLVNINPASTAGPEVFPFCHSAYDGQDLPLRVGAAVPVDYDYVHPLACNCNPAVVVSCQVTPVSPPQAAPSSTVFTETWPSTVAEQKPALIAAAEAASPLPPALPMLLVPPATAVNDILFEVND